MKKIKLPIDSLINFLNGRNAREKLFIVGLVGVFALFLLYFIWIGPVTKVFFESLPKLSVLGKELQSLKDDRKDKDRIQNTWRETQGHLAEKEKAFVASSEIPALLENLSKVAMETGVKITALNPGDVPSAGSGGAYVAVPVQMSALAGAHQLGSFLARLESGQTFFRVTDIKISANPSDEKRHLVSLVVETYRKE